jgi:hypothetical protein
MSEINVAAGTVDVTLPEGDQGDLVLRIYNKKTFISSTGETVLGTPFLGPAYYKDVPCTYVDGVLSYESFTIDSTEDAILDERGTSYAIAVFNADTYLYRLYNRLRVPDDPPDTTLSAIADFSSDWVATPGGGRLNGNIYSTPGTIGELIEILIDGFTELGAQFIDGVAPTVPTGLAATVLSGTSIKLDWLASTDDTGVAGYELSIDGGAAIDLGDVLTSTRTGLTSGTTYQYRVRAYDAAGNRSAYCTAVPATTSDTDAPSVPVMTAPSGVGESQITFNWNASTDNVGVTGYDLQVATDAGFTSIVSTHNLGAVLTYTKTGLNPSTTYYARVRAHDAVPNNSAYSSSTNATTTADATAPTVPTMSAATGITDTEITWNWTAATDNVAVTGYDLQVAEDAGFSVNLSTHNLGAVLTYTSTGLDPSTQYFARVRAHDAIPNNSAYSTETDATTDAPPVPSLWETIGANWTEDPGDKSITATSSSFAGVTHTVLPKFNDIGDRIDMECLADGGNAGSIGSYVLTDSLAKTATLIATGSINSTDEPVQFPAPWTVGDVVRLEKTGATQFTRYINGADPVVITQALTGEVELTWQSQTVTGASGANPVSNIS